MNNLIIDNLSDPLYREMQVEHCQSIAERVKSIDSFMPVLEKLRYSYWLNSELLKNLNYIETANEVEKKEIIQTRKEILCLLNQK